MFTLEKRQYKKHTFEDRLLAVQKVLNEHVSVREASKIIGADHMQVKYWVSMYERYGESGLRMRNFSYSGEFKTKVIEDMYKNRLTLYDTALKYGIPSPSTVLSWKRLYDSHGSAVLYKDSKMWQETMKSRKKVKQEKTLDPQTKALLKEVEYLKAENAYLKKLQALVQERLSQENGNEQPPFKN